MGNKMFTARLSTDSLNDLVRSLKNYNRSLSDLLELFIRRLVDEVGIPTVDKEFNQIVGDANPSHKCKFRLMSKNSTSATGVLEVEGEDILFIEFGAGIHYNGPAHQSPHPKGEEFGYRIGEYRPGSLGQFDSWRMPNGELTHGTKATMPVLNTAKEMRENVVKILKEVFG